MCALIIDEEWLGSGSFDKWIIIWKKEEDKDKKSISSDIKYREYKQLIGHSEPVNELVLLEKQ